MKITFSLQHFCCAPVVSCVQPPKLDWRAHTRNSEQGKKTVFNPHLPCRGDTLINKDTMVGWLYLQQRLFVKWLVAQ